MRSCVSEADAWAIATTSQPQLQNRARLVVDRDRPVESIVYSYAWVRVLQLPNSARKMDRGEAARRVEDARVLRAVMLSWAALAACPGYSASENATFWKRVISALQEDPDEPNEG